MAKQSLKVKEKLAPLDARASQDFLAWSGPGRERVTRPGCGSLACFKVLSSILDVGCGNGVMFEMIRERRLDLDYLGVDVTEKLLQVARQLFPADAHRFRQMSLYDLKKLRRKV